MNNIIEIKEYINNSTKKELEEIYILLITKKNNTVIEKIKSILLNSNFNRIDLNLKIRLYRAISRAYNNLDNIEQARRYFKEIFSILKTNESEIKKKDISNYIMSLREYLEYNKEKMKASEKKAVKEKLFECLKENNIKPSKEDLKNNLDIIITSSKRNLYI